MALFGSSSTNAMNLMFPSTEVTVKDPSSRLRKLKYSIGHRIAQERLISSSSSSCCTAEQQQHQQRWPLQHHDTNTTIHKNTNNNDTTTLLKSTTVPNKKKRNALTYRRPRGNLFHSASNGYYFSCTFLNDSNVVLCVDHYGIDAIQLSTSSGNDWSGNNNETTPLLGRAIATGIHATVPTASSSSLAPTLMKTTSIFGGQAFCTGLSSGEYQIFATEHASTWASATSHQINTLQPLKVSQRIPQDNTNHNSNNEMTTTTTTTTLPFIVNAWSVPGPQRRYKPDSRATLARQLRNASCVLNRNMDEIYQWNIHRHVHHQQQQSLPYSGGGNGGGPMDLVCHWDFRETSTSTLLALHVGKYNDNIGLRVLDSRGCSSTSSSSSSSNNRNQVGILVDMPEAMTVSACCFVTDNIIATAQHGALTPERIRLWDLRKMITPRKAKQNQLLVCPSFPREVVHALDPFQEPIHLLSQQQEEDHDDDHYDESSSLSLSAMRIIDLKSNNNGSLLVTTAQNCKNNNTNNNNDMMVHRHTTMQKHWIVDLSRNGGGGETVPVTLPYPVQQHDNSHCFLSSSSSPFAHDERCSVVATYQATGANHHHQHHNDDFASRGGAVSSGSGQQTISLYDINSNAERIMSNNTLQQQPNNNKKTKKRSRRQHQPREQEQDVDYLPQPIGYIDCSMDINDEYGLDSKLVSIAMNASGTAIVGVSRDSDLYYWTV